MKGLRVLELGAYLNGPFASRLMAELGAEVIKVEPPWGDPMRQSPPIVEGDSLHSIYYNAGKKFVTLNLKNPRGKDIFLELVKHSDILIENFKPGTMERLGLNYATVNKINPRIIYASITGWGENGPYRDLPAFDPIVQAVSGLMDSTGYPDRPTRAGMGLLDFVTPSFAVVAILAALITRSATGSGTFIDMSMFDVGVMLTMQSMIYLEAGYPVRQGPTSAVLAPEYLFQTQNGAAYVIIPNESSWEQFCKFIGKPDLQRDQRFRSLSERVENREILTEIVQEEVKKMKREDLVKGVLECGGAAAPLKDLSEVRADPQTVARNLYRSMKLGSKNLMVPDTVFKIQGYDCGIKWPGMKPGANNQEVYGELVHLSKEQISALVSDGVV